jgi:DNA-binding transcriptional ArsR family regulator
MQGGETAIARALGEPLRIQILAKLLGGPATVADLVAQTDSTQPNTSNHLTVLRDAGLVKGDRAGRQVRYRLAGAPVAELVEAIVAVSAPKSRRPPPMSPMAEARMCYDHVAGRLGVALLEALIREGALDRSSRSRTIRLGPRTDLLDRLRIDVATAASARRRFAFSCLDWTERRGHLGGALGASLADRLLQLRWLRRVDGTRALVVTATGRRGFRRALDIE